jgi:ribosome-binding protein aMBF1 (putative translation factor)
MATRFMDRFHEHLLEDPELREEYERLGPRFAVIRELARLRGEQQISQAELARRMNVSPSVVSRMESGEHSPRLDTIAAAARALGCDLEIKFKKREKRTRTRAA